MLQQRGLVVDVGRVRRGGLLTDMMKYEKVDRATSCSAARTSRWPRSP
jgi:hypothetical protein